LIDESYTYTLPSSLFDHDTIPSIRNENSSTFHFSWILFCLHLLENYDRFDFSSRIVHFVCIGRVRSLIAGVSKVHLLSLQVHRLSLRVHQLSPKAHQLSSKAHRLSLRVHRPSRKAHLLSFLAHLLNFLNYSAFSPTQRSHLLNFFP